MVQYLDDTVQMRDVHSHTHRLYFTVYGRLKKELCKFDCKLAYDISGKRQKREAERKGMGW